MSQTMVFYDGSCPVCAAEIDFYKRGDRRGALEFVDVSAPSARLPEAVDRAALMARFHATAPDGKLLSGARAFVAVWTQVPGWRVLARVAGLPGMLRLLEGLYRLFLSARPLLARGSLLSRPYDMRCALAAMAGVCAAAGCRWRLWRGRG